MDITDFASGLLSVEKTSDNLAAAASLLAEVVRYLNHSTLPGVSCDTLPDTAAISSLIGDLDQAAQRLPQLLTQAAARHRALCAEDSVSEELTNAAHVTAQVRDHLRLAHIFANQIPYATDAV